MRKPVRRAYPYGTVRARILALFADGRSRTVAEAIAALADFRAKVVADNVAVSANQGYLRNVGTRQRALYRVI